MIEEQHNHYQLVASALKFIEQKQREQPSLDEVAEKINLSPSHFRRVFEAWAGISPKKFLQFINVNYAKSLLRKKETTLFDVTERVGLSSTGRLHDLFIHFEGMTPGEFKNKGQNLQIEYSFFDTRFGQMIVASTPKGVCHLMYLSDKEDAIIFLKDSFFNAQFTEKQNDYHRQVVTFFDRENQSMIHLHLKGTDFQLKVWEALLQIPQGQIKTYKSIAESINKPTASRAVGTAIGNNPIAYLIPCHRVIQSSGVFGGYMWGEERKKAMLGWELSR